MAQAALARDVGGEVERKTVGVVELEHRLAVERSAAERRDVLLEDAHAGVQRARELLFLEQQHFLDLRLFGVQLRVGIAHLLGQRATSRWKNGSRARRACGRGGSARRMMRRST
jgi:hypothetical protein